MSFELGISVFILSGGNLRNIQLVGLVVDLEAQLVVLVGVAIVYYVYVVVYCLHVRFVR